MVVQFGPARARQPACTEEDFYSSAAAATAAAGGGGGRRALPPRLPGGTTSGTPGGTPGPWRRLRALLPGCVRGHLGGGGRGGVVAYRRTGIGQVLRAEGAAAALLPVVWSLDCAPLSSPFAPPPVDDFGHSNQLTRDFGCSGLLSLGLRGGGRAAVPAVDPLGIYYRLALLAGVCAPGPSQLLSTSCAGPCPAWSSASGGAQVSDVRSKRRIQHHSGTFLRTRTSCGQALTPALSHMRRVVTCVPQSGAPKRWAELPLKKKNTPQKLQPPHTASLTAAAAASAAASAATSAAAVAAAATSVGWAQGGVCVMELSGRRYRDPAEVRRGIHLTVNKTRIIVDLWGRVCAPPPWTSCHSHSRCLITHFPPCQLRGALEWLGGGGGSVGEGAGASNGAAGRPMPPALE